MKYLRNSLRSHISSSTHTETSNIIIIEDLVGLTGLAVSEIVGLNDKISKMKRKPNVVLNVLDFDDTLYSRINQLQLPLLQDNRGIRGNEVINNEIGLNNFIETQYSETEVVEKLRQIIENQNAVHKSIILTAGEKILQLAKCEKVGIGGDKSRVIVVDNAKSKPMKLVREIIKLGYIPGKIIVYEDRPEHFLGNNGVSLAKLLGIEIVVNHIFLDEIQTNKIKEIKQNTFAIN
ncbi:MAG: hypothetical protein PHV23_00515 [Candidatus Gracilibacteria bacterium]|nr:hypothetical protein [Candidatus Gracilibacteria bacterium]